MPFAKGSLYPCNPSTERATSTKLSISKDKLIYTNGRTVIIRDLNNPALASAYSGHVKNVTVARFSPSGYYCASADVQGTVRIWDTVGADRTLKGEYRVLSGKINDLAWDGESKRIIAVGDGKEKFGHAFMFDSGTSTGEIGGHSKIINAVSIRHQRPFRAATASDDGSIVFHSGAPYKYEKTIKTHTKFVQDVRYASSGDHFASVGSDSKAFIYDGKTGDTVAELSDGGHKGSIMSCSWSSDNKSLVTSSLDCTVKLWDVESRKAVQSWVLGTGVNHQQVGNVWASSGEIISLSTSGVVNVFDRRVGDKPARFLMGPQKPITAGTLVSGTFLAGTSDGRIVSFASGGEASALNGEGHSNLISGISAGREAAYSVAYDDRLREISANAKEFTAASTTLNMQPKALSVSSHEDVFVAEISKVEVFRSNQKLTDVGAEFGPSSIACTSNAVAVGGEDSQVHLYEWDGKALKESDVLKGNRGIVTAVAFSPDDSLLAAGDSSGRIILFDVKERKEIESRWTFHSGRIHSISWTPDGKYLASGSLDTHVYIWSVKRPLSNIAIRNAGPNGVNTVAWLESDEKRGKLISAGADGCARTWDITFIS